MNPSRLMPDDPWTEMPVRERRACASALRARKSHIAASANDEFFRRHPDWHARFGESAHRRGVEDAGFHVEFLAGAMECGEPGAFVSYVAWLMDVLGARGIGADHVAESLELVGREAMAVVDSGGRESLDRLLLAGIARTQLAAIPLTEQADGSTSPMSNASRAFVQALLQGERQGALGIAREALRVAAHPTDVYVEVFQRSLEEIGRRWQLNRITVAQEHMATAVVQFVLAQLYSSLDRNAPVRGTAIVTGVAGELHQVGANLVADALELDGWRVRFLGANVPHDGIVEAVNEFKADLVGISATMLFNIDPVANLVDGLRSLPGGRVPRVLVGGSAFRSSPQLWKDLGADGFAVDVRGACSAARSPAGSR